MMQKYPVTSTKGNTYHVEVSECRYYKHHYEVGIYHKYKGWFNKDSYKLINEGFMGHIPSYNASEYEFDLVLMVKSIINGIEDKREQIENKKKLLNKAENDFNEWDGKC